ncbi:MAG: tetratricopeptide repeat protein [Bryobacteraceae bacterium]
MKRFAAFALLSSLCAAGADAFQTRGDIVRRAEALEGQEDYAGAAALWRDILNADPTDVQALAMLGLLSSKQKKYAEAEDLYHRALRLLPDNPQLLLNLALAYFKNSDLKQAIPVFEQVVKLRPENQQARTLLGISYYGVGDFQKAIPLLEQSPEGQTSDSMRQMLVQAYLWTKQTDKAEKELTELARTSPNSAAVHVLMAEALDASGRPDAAIEQFQAALKISDSDPNVHFGLGYMYWKRKDDQLAESEFRRELQIDPSNAHAMTYLADIELRRDHLEEASKLLRTAVGLQDNIYLARYDLGVVLQKQGKHREAIPELRKAVALDAKRPEAHYRLATSYRALGETGEAAEQLRIVQTLQDKGAEDDVLKAGGSGRNHAPPDLPQ